ncbi:MAG: N-acetylglucosamine-specific PTS transporter subunit IIBC [Candidatus Ancillula sp.]|jgi:PTS system N-acetylglucosamine-specific IIC component|nr:N-acetylglucosamine-specific PTS transporter subunit IIBC [Candidatus Ancillula sp.]
MKFLQNLGKSLMLPVAVLPIAAIFVGISYWIDSSGGKSNIVAIFLGTAGGAIIGNMPLLFAVGVSLGMAKNADGTSALSGLISWLVVTKLLSPESIALLTSTEIEAVNPAYGKVQNQFIGILCGLISAFAYNKFKDVKLHRSLDFFSGKRCVAIVTGGISLLIAFALYFLWPLLFTGLVNFGEMISKLGPVGAGIYGLLNRLLIPIGMHHAVNSVFWFDVAGINDLNNFLSATGVYGTTGQYMTGFFPIMMFGLPGAALAMYMTAKTKNKKIVFGLLLSTAFTSFFTGITEPFEFSFMFISPLLFGIHAVLTGISLFICNILPVRMGFGFSAGFTDLVLNWNNPMAQNPWIILLVGLVFFVLYFIIFYLLIKKLHLKTLGQEEDSGELLGTKKLGDDKFSKIAQDMIAGLGGIKNIEGFDNCITRLRVEVGNMNLVNDRVLKSAGALGVMRPGGNSLQVIIGTDVQFIADCIRPLLSQSSTTEVVLLAPITGKVIPIKKLSDTTFSQGLLGAGIAILPESSEVYAPFDGVVDTVFASKHAITLKDKHGLQVLIHIGIETVHLNGEHFKKFVENGQKVKAGDKLLKFDLKEIESKGYELSSPVVICNVQDAVFTEADHVKHGDEIARVQVG